jgi:hypothetical protein
MFTVPPQTSGGCAGVPNRNPVFLLCMAVRDRGAVAVHHQIILGLPRKSWWVTQLFLTWCSGFIAGISIILWFACTEQ